MWRDKKKLVIIEAFFYCDLSKFSGKDICRVGLEPGTDPAIFHETK